MAKDQDRSYRRLFSHPRMVRELLRHFVPEPWVEELDLTDCQKMSDSYVSDDLRERCQDVLWRVRWRDRQLYVYLMIEFQSRVDRFMAVRMLGYVGLLYQDLIRRRELTPEGQLPPVLSILIYNGREPWWAASELAQLMAPVPASLARYQPQLSYLVFDQGHFPRERLEPITDAVTALFRLEQSRDPEELEIVITRLAELLSGADDEPLRRDLTLFLRQVLLPRRLPEANMADVNDLQEIRSMLRENVLKWTQEWREEGLQAGFQEGIQQGIQRGLWQGRHEGEAALLRRQLERRFGRLDETHQQLLHTATEEQLLDWGDRLLSAAALDDVFADQHAAPAEEQPG